MCPAERFVVKGAGLIEGEQSWLIGHESFFTAPDGIGKLSQVRAPGCFSETTNPTASGGLVLVGAGRQSLLPRGPFEATDDCSTEGSTLHTHSHPTLSCPDTTT